LVDRHAGGEIALLDPPGGVDQLADRPHQPVGERSAVKIARPTMISAPSSSAR
jgi:hypothetical protein